VIRWDGVQGTPEWLEVRRGVITASTFGQIITPKTGKVSASAERVARKVVAEMLTGTVDQSPITKAMEWGIIHEPSARDWYELIHDCTVEQVGFCFLDERLLVGCSPDGLVGDDGGIEIKCVNAADHLGFLLDGEVPAEHLPQIQGCMWITGRQWWDYVSYHPDLPAKTERVYRSETYIDALAVAVTAVAEMVAGYLDRMAKAGIKPRERMEVVSV